MTYFEMKTAYGNPKHFKVKHHYICEQAIFAIYEVMPASEQSYCRYL